MSTLCPSTPPAVEKAAHRVMSSGELSCLSLGRAGQGQEGMREKETALRTELERAGPATPYCGSGVVDAPSPFEAVRRADSEVMRAVSWPCTSPGQHSRAGPGRRDVGEQIQRERELL